MRRAQHRLVAILDAALREAGWQDVRSAHVSVLASVHPDGSRLTDIVARGGRTKQAAAELATHLAARGYLDLTPDPRDKRAKIYRPTGRGLRLLLDCEQVVDGYENWLAETLGVSSVKRLRGALETIVTGAGPRSPEA